MYDPNNDIVGRTADRLQQRGSVIKAARRILAELRRGERESGHFARLTRAVESICGPAGVDYECDPPDAHGCPADPDYNCDTGADAYSCGKFSCQLDTFTCDVDIDFQCDELFQCENTHSCTSGHTFVCDTNFECQNVEQGSSFSCKADPNPSNETCGEPDPADHECQQGHRYAWCDATHPYMIYCGDPGPEYTDPRDPPPTVDDVPGDFRCGLSGPISASSFDCTGTFKCEASDDFDCFGPLSDFDCGSQATFECTDAQEFACFNSFDCQNYFRCKNNVDAFHCLTYFSCKRAGDTFDCGQDTTPKYDCDAGRYENPAQ